MLGRGVVRGCGLVWSGEGGAAVSVGDGDGVCGDPDPDTFRVCDKRADGHGVTGKLYLYMGGWQLKETKSDGGDAGCGYFDYNVVPYAAKYMMKLCWNGPGEVCVQKEFTED